MNCSSLLLTRDPIFSVKNRVRPPIHRIEFQISRKKKDKWNTGKTKKERKKKKLSELECNAVKLWIDWRVYLSISIANAESARCRSFSRENERESEENSSRWKLVPKDIDIVFQFRENHDTTSFLFSSSISCFLSSPLFSDSSLLD